VSSFGVYKVCIKIHSVEFIIMTEIMMIMIMITRILMMMIMMMIMIMI